MMETKVSKGHYGYEALTEIPLSGVSTISGGPGSEAVLRISTAKRSSGGLSTFASVVCKAPDGGFSFMAFQDYSKNVGANPVRCTEKNVRALHALVLAEVAMIEADARAYYAAKEAA
jgi:hypothetical protein